MEALRIAMNGSGKAVSTLTRRGVCPGVSAESSIQGARLRQPLMTSMTRRVIQPLGVLLQQQHALVVTNANPLTMHLYYTLATFIPSLLG